MKDEGALQSQSATNDPILLVIAAAFLAFGGSFGSSFHLDDYQLFSDRAITSFSGWWHIWHPLQTRPLTYFTFWLNYQVGGHNPIGYHAVNLVLHLLVVWLLYGILVRIVGERPALIAAAIFALHPLQTEAVVYIFARATLVSTLFCLISMRSWLDGRYWSSAGWFALALLGKEECVTFPIFLLLIRRSLLPAAGMLCLSLAAGARVLLALKMLHISGAGATAGISPLDYFTTQSTVVLRYLRLFLLPYGFTFDPDIPVVRDWHAWVAWAALVGIAVLLWRLHRHGRWFAAGLILLAPSSTIFPAQDLAADRRFYLPMLAFATLAGLLIGLVNRRVILILVMMGLAVASLVRTHVWSTEHGLWEEAVQRSPAKLRPRIMLARASDIEMALQILSVAQDMAPHDPRPALEKGLRLMEQEQPDLALVEFGRALTIEPNDPMSLNDHGAALAKLGQRDKAIEDFRHALYVDPCWANARTNLERLGVSYPIPCN